MRTQIAKGGSYPEWRKDGKEIIYVTEGAFWSVRVEPSGVALHFSAPQMLFSGFRSGPGASLASRPLAVSRDGSRIYSLQAVEQPDTNMIHVKIGWKADGK